MRHYGLVLVGLCAATAAFAGCGGSAKEEQGQGDLTVTGAPTGEIKGQPRYEYAIDRVTEALEERGGKGTSFRLGSQAIMVEARAG